MRESLLRRRWAKTQFERHSLRICIKVKLQKLKNKLSQKLEKRLENWLSVNSPCCSYRGLELGPSTVGYN